VGLRTRGRDIVVDACSSEYFSYDHETFRQYNELGVDQAIILEAETSSSPATVESALDRQGLRAFRTP